MPNINEMFLKLEGFWYAASLDLNMEYYHIQFSEDKSNLCAIIIPGGKYHFKLPPMGLVNPTDLL